MAIGSDLCFNRQRKTLSLQSPTDSVFIVKQDWFFWLTMTAHHVPKGHYTACPTWEDIYYRDDPCQFKDWAARKHGNAFDLWTSYDKIMTEKDESSKGIYKNLTEYKYALDEYEYREASGKLVFGSSRNRWFYFCRCKLQGWNQGSPKRGPKFSK